MKPCTGTNCGSTEPRLHSAECFAQHEAAVKAAAELEYMSPLAAIRLLVKTYVANPGTQYQYISCVTPGKTGPIPTAWEVLRKVVAP